MKKLLTSSLMLLLALPLLAAPEEEKKSETDTLDAYCIKKIPLNDYTTIGVDYGAVFSQALFNPSQYSQDWCTQFNHISLMWTRYGKMFGYMPYFGLTAGFSYTHQGFMFKNVDGKTPQMNVGKTADGQNIFVTGQSYHIFEIPLRAKFHYDMQYFKIMADLGIYGAYRWTIDRRGDNTAGYQKTFSTTDIRWDYGLEGGFSVAFMLDPVELHLGALVRWSWSNYWQANYYSEYYYRYAYPLDIVAYCGIHFQLTRRKGKTNHQLKKEARNIVYNKEVLNEVRDSTYRK